jgi:hypothetical protein
MEEFNLQPEQQKQGSISEPSFVSKKRSFGVSGWLMTAGILVLLGVLVTIGIGGARLWLGVNQAQDALEQAREYAAEFAFEEASGELALARAGFEDAQSGVGFFFWMKPIPWVGNQIEGAELVLNAGIESVDALESGVVVAADVYKIIEEAKFLLEEHNLPSEFASFADVSSEVRNKFLVTLGHSHDDLLDMQVKLLIAQQDLADLHDLKVSNALLSAVAPFEDLLPGLLSGVEFFIPLSATVGEIAGVGESRQWMFLSADHRQFRPGGGVIDYIALVTIEDAEIKNIEIRDVSEIDELAQLEEGYTTVLPAGLDDALVAQKWLLRDALLSPDFSSSAATSISLVQDELSLLGQPVPEIHGVFIFTSMFLERLVHHTGPVEVEGKLLGEEHLYQLLHTDAHEESERVMLLAGLARTLLDEMYEMPLAQWQDLFAVFTGQFSEKQIALYSTDEQTQGAMVDAGWSGVTEFDLDDHLAVVDTYISGSTQMRREVTYRIVPDGDGYMGQAEVTYISYDDLGNDHQVYAQVYAPAQSVFVSVEGAAGGPVVETQLDMMQFGAPVTIPGGTTQVVTFSYTIGSELIEAIDSGLYQLKVFRQLGTRPYALTLDLDFGKTVAAAEPTEDASQFGDTLYSLEVTLDQDMVFTAQLAP